MRSSIRKVMILHHIQGQWFRSSGVKKEAYLESLKSYLDRAKSHYDKIILTYWDGEGDFDEDYDFSWLRDYVDDIVEYGYCWHYSLFEDTYEAVEDGKLCVDDLPNQIEDYGDTFVRNYKGFGYNGENYSMVPDFLVEEKNSKITLLGMFDGQCISDMETAMEHLEINYVRKEELIRK